MKKILTVIALVVLVAGGAFAADLSVDAQFDVSGKDASKGFLTVKGALGSVEKDSLDVTTGASKKKGTETWNLYRADANKKNTIPGGIQSLVKYAVSPKTMFDADQFSAVKAADGTITIQYVHRGTAYLFVTDKMGKLVLPKGDYKARKIGFIPKDSIESVIAPEFSATGKPAGIDWKKVWDPKTPDGVVIAGTTNKTGPITDDVPPADAKAYEGVLQVTLVGNVLTVKGDLNLKK